MMQAAVQVFAEKGYHAATVRDVVNQAGVAIGTFYFYFPDKETLFVYLYEETADFLMQTLQQAVNQQVEPARQVAAGVQAYVSLAVYEPSIIQLLLVGGVGAVPSLNEKRVQFRERMISMWRHVIEDLGVKNGRFSAELIAGGFDEIVLNLLTRRNPDVHATATIEAMTALLLRLAGHSEAIAPDQTAPPL
jgi:AcrR family transcriptional regulator